MRWNNKGNEYVTLVKNVTQIRENTANKIYVFGAGIKGEYIYNILKWFGCFAMFIDNNPEKQNNGKCGEAVISLEEYKNNYHDGIVVVAVDNRYIDEICNQLNACEFVENINYFRYSDFLYKAFPILQLTKNNLLFTEMMQICLTEKCTLKCKKCAHGCYNVPMDAKDVPLEEIQNSVDLFFERIDKVWEFALLGGEPFLYNQIDEVVEYIGSRYRDKIHNFVITTNGTIVPKDRILEICKKYDVLIRISNYSVNIKNVSNLHEKLSSSLDNKAVNYHLGEADYYWMDYGFGELDRQASEDELIRVFDACETPCRELRKGRIYYCVQARSTGENLRYNVGEDDYLNLADVKEKMVILEFLSGYSEKGYLDMCNYCYGAEAVNHLIPVAEQVKNG